MPKCNEKREGINESVRRDGKLTSKSKRLLNVEDEAEMRMRRKINSHLH